MNECAPNKTTLVENLNFDALESDEYYESLCQSLLGCLMYVMVCTRPDLSFAVNFLSRYVNKNKIGWEYLKDVLRYLRGTSDLRLIYRKNKRGNFEILTGYVDSDWAGDKTPRRSNTGFLFKLYD